MSSRKRNQVIEEFIEIYRSEPCLWRVKSKEYHYREKRDAAYERLVIKLKELEPDATKKSVVKKINNLRSNVRKEKKKRDMSMKSGASTDNVYTSKLWYLDLFDFLGDQDTPGASVSNLDDEDGSEIDEEGIEDPAPQTPSNEEPSEKNENPPNHARPNSDERAVIPISRPYLAKKRKTEELTNDVLLSVRDHFKKPSPQDDRYDLMGKSIAMRIRSLEKRQRLIVEKRINDLLFEAEMGMLNVPTSSYSSEYLSSPSSSTSLPSPSAAVSYDQFTQQTATAGFVTNEELPPPHSMATYLANFNNI